VAQPWCDVHSQSRRGLLNALMEFHIDVEMEMAHRAFALTLRERCCVPLAQSPLHDVAQYGRTRPAEVTGELVHVRPRRGVKARIHADA
jgi:hypothetical protein